MGGGGGGGGTGGLREAREDGIRSMLKVIIWLAMADGGVQGQHMMAELQVPTIVVFGDSTVDSGNNNYLPTIAKSNYEPYGRDFFGGKPTGRFCNGRIITDFICEAFGLNPLVPAYLDPTYTIRNFSLCVSFASAGTGYDNATSDILGVIPLWKEIEYYKEYQRKLRGYLGEEKAEEHLNKALYLVSIGTNDFLINYYLVPGRSVEFSVGQYESFLLHIARSFIIQLHHLGARKMAVAGLPPMGCLPLQRTMNILSKRDCNRELNNVSREFNRRLGRLIGQLNKQLPGIQLVLVNIYDPLLDIIQDPNSFGFKNGATACCGTGMVELGKWCSSTFTCSDADNYVFWDAMHPTEKTYRILADYFMNIQFV